MENNYLKKAVLSHKKDILTPFNKMFDIIGFEGICLLNKEFGGSNLYIPSINKIFKKCIYKQIIKEFDGSNYKELSLRYNVSERNVRSTIYTTFKKI